MILVKVSKEKIAQCNSCLTYQGTFFDVEISSDPQSALKLTMCEDCLHSLGDQVFQQIDETRSIPF